MASSLTSNQQARALDELLGLIDAGVEYPDAHTQICMKYDFSEQDAARLSMQYDLSCNEQCHVA